MTITDQYLEALKQVEGWVTGGEWALKVAEVYPDLLEKANEQARGQATPTTGMRELTARINSSIGRGAYEGKIEIDATEYPRKIRYATEEEIQKHVDEELDEEMESLTRSQKIRKEYDELSDFDKYRIQELESIAKAFNYYFKTDLEVDHAQALMGDIPGIHHPDNLQLLSKTHNRIKSKASWDRMSLEKQLEYLYKMKAYHIMVFSVDDGIFASLIERIKKVY